MADANEELLAAFDGHNIAGVRAALKAGADACTPIRGKLPVLWLLEQYTRSDALVDCLQLLFERGARLPDPVLTPVLLNDGPALSAAIGSQPGILQHRTSLRSTFTPMAGVTLLHVAAEYGFLDAARVLVEAGANVNARAEVDADGLNGHTPLFHTVNSAYNRSEPIMRLLLAAGANADIRLAGITWGVGFDWETTFFDVTPISYAQMGLMPQVHRREQDVYSNIKILLESLGRPVRSLRNIPNRYLRPK